MSPSYSRPPRRALLAVLLSFLLLGSFLPAQAYPDGPWLVPGKPYARTSQWVSGHSITIGDLADPHIYSENGTYYAYGTNGGGRNVPLVTSTDLKNWTTNQHYRPPATSPDGRPVLNASDPWYNDTLALPGSWAQRNSSCNTAVSGCYEIWAPSVEKTEDGTYLMAYAARAASTTAGIDRWCIGLATAKKPTGPFFDTSSTPFVCSDDPAGAIDPDLYKDQDGSLYLYWKNEGNAALHTKTNLWVRELDEDGSSWAEGSQAQSLLATSVMSKAGYPDAQTWEETLIENPSMVYWQGAYYLFYSANQYSTLDYRTGYARCQSATGPCQRIAHTPLLSTDPTWSLGGPGGSNAFIDQQGRLRLASAAWRPDRAGYDTRWNQGANACQTIERFFYKETACTSNQRFLHISTLEAFGPAQLLAAPKKSEFAWTAQQKTPSPISFKDITSSTQFYPEMMWLAHTGVSLGYPDATYRPGQPIERAAMAAFLYRLAGSPAYTPPAQSPWSDVPSDHPFYREIMWMRSVGISSGYPDGSFRPHEEVSREAMAAFMYRAAGSPATGAWSDFRDTGSSQFQREIGWLRQQGISTGYSDGSFRPQDSVGRDAMAAFMYRLTQVGPLYAAPRPAA